VWAGDDLLGLVGLDGHECHRPTPARQTGQV
jgi:hypothetical protein